MKARTQGRRLYDLQTILRIFMRPLNVAGAGRDLACRVGRVPNARRQTELRPPYGKGSGAVDVSDQTWQLRAALENISQGLLMFDRTGRIVLVNRRYIEMYRVSPEVVKPGCTLRELMHHRKATGLFAGDVEAYCTRLEQQDHRHD
jgi:PAS domain-containing protein